MPAATDVMDLDAKPASEAALLDIRGLKTHFATDDGIVQAVDGVDITVGRGETVCVVGESGCGKTVTALSVLKLIAMPPGRIAGGQILWQGRDIVPLPPDEMNRIRAREIAIVFQEPMTSLNPVYTIGDQIGEVIALHEGLSRKGVLERTIEMLALVQIPNPKRRVNDYPHQFSGGMRQRVMIAMALSCRPKLLIADEPTTALDVTIQAQILDLLQDMKSRFGMSILLITHAMGVVAEVAQSVVVMYAGKVVAEASVGRRSAKPGCRRSPAPCPGWWIRPPGAASHLAAALQPRNAAGRSHRCASSNRATRWPVFTPKKRLPDERTVATCRETDETVSSQKRPVRSSSRQRARGRRRRFSHRSRGNPGAGRRIRLR